MIPIIFDLDGTLIDSLPSLTKAVNGLLATKQSGPLDVDTVRGFVGSGERILLERMIATTGIVVDDFEGLRREFLDFYNDAAKETVLMPGAVEALAVLKSEGFPLGLVTNKPREPLVPTLQAVDLDRYFDIVMAGDDLSKRKPDPEPLLHAVRELGAKRCVYVGDSDVDGVTAARAGQSFVLYTEGIRTVPVAEIPHEVAFDDFKDLPEICRKLSAA